MINDQAYLIFAWMYKFKSDYHWYKQEYPENLNRKIRDRLDGYLPGFWVLKKVNKIIKGLQWVTNTNYFLFSYEREMIKSLLPVFIDQRQRLLRDIIHNQRIRLRRPAPPKIGKKIYEKVPFNEERVLEEILNREAPDLNVKTYEPFIGIELEVERGPWQQWDTYPGRPPVNWSMREDGSLSSGGMELVSPPLKVEKALNEFTTLAKKLRETTAQGDDGCGLHFHIGLHDRHVDDIFNDPYYRDFEKRVLNYIITRRKNKGFQEIFHEDRYENYYCSLKPCERYERYHAVNFGAYSKHGTIEIRFCAVEPNFNDRWIKQFKEFVNWTVNELYPQWNDPEPYRYMGELKVPIKYLARISPIGGLNPVG